MSGTIDGTVATDLVSLNETDDYILIDIKTASSYTLQRTKFEGLLGMNFNEGDFNFVRQNKLRGLIGWSIFGIGIREDSHSCSSDLKIGTHSKVQDGALEWHPVASSGKWDLTLGAIEYGSGSLTEEQLADVPAEIDTGASVIALKRSLFTALLAIIDTDGSCS